MVAHRAESDNYYVLVISFSPQTDLNSPASLKRRSRTFATGAPLDTCYAIFLKTHAEINGHAEIFQTWKFSTIFESNASISRNSQTLRNQLTPNVVGQHEVGDRLAISKLTSIADLNRTLVSIRSIVKWRTSAGLRAEAWLTLETSLITPRRLTCPTESLVVKRYKHTNGDQSKTGFLWSRLVMSLQII